MTTDSRPGRLEAVGRRLVDLGAEAMLVSALPNIRYLTGFTGSAGLLLVAPDGSADLVVDFRYATQAPDETGGIVEVAVDHTNVWARVGQAIARRGPATLAVEATNLTLADRRRLQETAGAKLLETDGVVEQLRVVKDEAEVDAIRAATALAQEALAEVLGTIRVGDTELEVAARLEAGLRRRGSEWHPFQTIVASGPRSALPHARTSARPVGRGELLLLDFGATVQGYCADLTRMVVVGAPADARQREVHAAVQEAQLLARTRIRAGMTGREADALARDRLAVAGLAEAFGHSLGHGLGLEVHEAPRLAPTAEGRLPAGAVVTIEPGVYFPGWGGVRLEDDLWLGPEGPTCLSDGRTDLLALT